MIPQGLGTGLFNTTPYAAPLAQGLGTGTAGMGLGPAGTDPSSLAVPSGGLSSSQIMMLANALGGFNKPQPQMQATPLPAASQPDPVASISAGPQMLANRLGAYHG